MGFVLGDGDFDGGRGRTRFNTQLLKVLCYGKDWTSACWRAVSWGNSSFCFQRMQVSPMAQQNWGIGHPPPLPLPGDPFSWIFSFFWVLSLLLSPAQPGDPLPTSPLVLWNVFAFPVLSCLQWLPHAYPHPYSHLPGAVCLSSAPFLSRMWEYLKSHKDLVIPAPLLLNKTWLGYKAEEILGSEGRFIASLIHV